MIVESLSYKSNKNKPKNIFITGGSSGIGYQAVRKLINDGHNLIVPCRDKERVSEVLNTLSKDISTTIEVKKQISLPIIDLSDLQSIENYFSQIDIEQNSIDCLILNAGLQYTGADKPKLSKQDIELTFAVNHLSHYYLVGKLVPKFINSNKSRIIVTSSEVHNPQTSGGRIGKSANLGDLIGLQSGKSFLMLDGSSVFNADKSYKDSKLCNILFAIELYSRLQNKSVRPSIIAWAPGLVIPRTSKGFFRYSRKYNELGQRIFAFLARDIFRISDSTENAGSLLAQLATKEQYTSDLFKYFSNKLISPGKFNLEEADISEEANNHNLSYKLWELSDKLILESKIK